MFLKTVFENVAILLSGLGVLLVGFALLSDNIGKLANKGVKKLFDKASDNPLVGVGIGATTTAVIQSSGATTVMIVGFVNAGLMTLSAATAMIMGANIGTTVTALLASLPVKDIAFILAAIGALWAMLTKKPKLKAIANAITGLGLVFVGISLMKTPIGAYEAQIQTALKFIKNPILLILFGAAITALVQSSSAITSIIVVMAASIAGFQVGGTPNGVLFVILGTNIGSCVTALLSSLGSSTNAKRASFIHLMFNTIGTVLFAIVFVIWKDFYNVVLDNIPVDGGMKIAIFHIMFNVCCTLIFLPFRNLFVKAAITVIKDKKSHEELLDEEVINSLDDRFLQTPQVALKQSVTAISTLGYMSMDNLNIAIKGFFDKDLSVAEKVNKNNERIDNLSKLIVSYLVKIASKVQANDDEQLIVDYQHVLTDLIRVIEIADNVLKYTKKCVDGDITFSEPVYDAIHQFQSMLNEQFDNVNQILLGSKVDLRDDVIKLEDDMDALRSSLIADHIKRLEEGKCKPISSGVFINFISNLERAGDHLEVIATRLVK